MSSVFGKAAYEAYCASSNNKSLVSGCELPQWEELKAEIKMAWIAAAGAVIELCKVLYKVDEEKCLTRKELEEHIIKVVQKNISRHGDIYQALNY